MSKYVKDSDGNTYLVNDENIVTREQLVANVEKATELLNDATNRLNAFDTINQPVTPEPTPEPTPVEPQPTPEPAATPEPTPMPEVGPEPVEPTQPPVDPTPALVLQ